MNDIMIPQGDNADAPKNRAMEILEVTSLFIHAYLQSPVEDLAGFYGVDSQFTRVEGQAAASVENTVVGVENIKEKLQPVNNVHVTSVDCQESLNGSVLVLMSGSLIYNNVPRNFIQSFLLCPIHHEDSTHYYIRNDLLRFTEVLAATPVSVSAAPASAPVSVPAPTPVVTEVSTPSPAATPVSAPAPVVEAVEVVESAPVAAEPVVAAPVAEPVAEPVVEESKSEVAASLPQRGPKKPRSRANKRKDSKSEQAETPAAETQAPQTQTQTPAPAPETKSEAPAKPKLYSQSVGKAEAAAASPAPVAPVTSPAPAPTVDAAAPSTAPEAKRSTPSARGRAGPRPAGSPRDGENGVKPGFNPSLLYASNIPDNESQENVVHFFSGFGGIKNVREPPHGRGYWIIHFVNPEIVDSVLAKPLTYGDRELEVSRHRPNRYPADGVRGGGARGRGRGGFVKRGGRGGRGRGNFAGQDGAAPASAPAPVSAAPSYSAMASKSSQAAQSSSQGAK